MPEDTNTSVDLDTLTVQELQEQQELVSRKLAEKREADKAGILAQIVDVSRAYAITSQDIVKALAEVDAQQAVTNNQRGVTIPPKYRDPETGKTWAGRGKLPAFIRDSGKDREHFLIREGA